MGITEELFHLGQAARRLNDGSDELNRLLAAIDKALARLMLGLEYQLTRPLAEIAHRGEDGKRTIEVHYLGYLRIEAPPGSEAKLEPGFHLALRTIKVLEDRRAADSEAPGQITPLLEAPRRLRHLAVDQLPALVAGLAGQIDDMVEHIERRCAIAEAILDRLEHEAPAAGEPAASVGGED